MAYDLGDTVALGVQIKDDAGTLTDPSSITLTITLPDGTTSTPTPTHDDTGLYSYAYVTTQAGRHVARWVSEAPGTAYVDAFDVSSASPPLIVSLGDAKAFLNIAATDTGQDEELRGFIEALTAPVEKICGSVIRRTVTDHIRPRCADRAALPHSPVISVTSAALVSDDTAVDVTTWYVVGNVLYTTDGTALPSEPFTLTYVVGRTDLPANIRLGALYVLKLAWRSQRGNNPDSFMPFLVANAAQEWFAGDEQLLGFA